MRNLIKITVLGLMENMNYLVSPDYEKEINLLEESDLAEIVQKHDIPLTGRLSIDLRLAAAYDAELIELFDGNWA